MGEPTSETHVLAGDALTRVGDTVNTRGRVHASGILPQGASLVETLAVSCSCGTLDANGRCVDPGAPLWSRGLCQDHNTGIKRT